MIAATPVYFFTALRTMTTPPVAPARRPSQTTGCHRTHLDHLKILDGAPHIAHLTGMRLPLATLPGRTAAYGAGAPRQAPP